MENETLKQIINQIKKYNLTESFSDIEQFKKWISKLNTTQINNFLALDIDFEEIKNLNDLLINCDLLNCEDYKQKVAAISTLKNGDGYWHLFDSICQPNFLKSKNFYKDIEMLSKADTVRHCLRILGEDSFIKSPYHDEDLNLIVEARDFLVSDALATVASNIDSIKSPYHQADMKLISTARSDCLQMSHTYPEKSLNNLAINKESLLDKYHVKNMQILATAPVAREFLYMIMTNPEIIKGKYYQKEVEALLNAKSKHTARMLYYYIVNPRSKFISDFKFHDDYEYDRYDSTIKYSEYVSGKVDTDYIENLTEINQIDDEFVMHYVSLLMNPDFINSKYKKFDLELLKTISCKSIFVDLYTLMLNKSSLRSNYHKQDAVIISQIEDDAIRDLLLRKAIDENSLNSNNHEYDMQYISRLNIDSIDEQTFDEIYYYLFHQKGIDDNKHKEKLEKLLQGILVEREPSLSDYLDSLQAQIENSENNSHQIFESVPNSSYEPKTKILDLIRKYIKKQR